jgi:pimeloyl-ACP methyl ester carboxylesterase
MRVRSDLHKSMIAGLILMAGCRTSGPAAQSPRVLSASEVRSREATLIKSCPPPVVPSPSASANSPIHVTSWGTAGSRVLIIHGNVQSGLPIGGGPKSFAKQKVLGEHGWRLELPDRPGFGDSPSRGPDDQDADAAWIADMLSSGAHLWGHSFGGTEALLAAARRPDAVRSLVLIEPALWDLLEGDPLYRNRPDVQTDLDTRDQAIENAHSPGEYASMFMVSFQPGSGGAQETALRAAVSIVPGLSKKIGCALLQAHYASDDEVRKDAATVAAAHIPVLVITGGWNPGRDAMGEVVARLTGGKHVVVRSPNHIVMASNPGDFNEVVESFMRDAEHSSARQQ